MAGRPPTQAARPNGFTLVELCFVVLISGIVLAVGAIRLGRLSVFMANSKRVAYRLASDLRYAQSEAIADARNHYLLFTSNGTKLTSYAIYRVEAGGDVVVEPSRTLPDSVALTGSSTRAEFTTDGSALANYSYSAVSPGPDYAITVVLATGVVQLQESQ